MNKYPIMKASIALLISLIISVNAIGQVERNRYQTLSSVIQITASKNGESYIYENKNVNLVLDYKVGNFQAEFSNMGFVLTTDATSSSLDSLETEREFAFKGILPIDEIIQQLVIKKQYFVELELINWELDLNETLSFDLTVTNPGNTQQNYRMYSLHCKMKYQHLQLAAFEGFDDDVEIWINWTAYAIIH